MKKSLLSLSRTVGLIAVLLISTFPLCACREQAVSGWCTADGGTYYYIDGEAAEGWLELDGSHFYFGSGGVMVTGWQKIGGETYYFHDDGTMAAGWLELDGSRYYLRQDGTLVTGWLSLDGQRYYLNEDGTAVSGITAVNGTAYVFDAQGTLTSGWTEVDGLHLYGDSNAHPVSGWVEIGGTRYYFEQPGIAHTGWLEADGFTYYFLEDGSPAQGKCTIDGETHYFASTGQHILLANPWNLVPADYTVELKQIDANHQVAEVAYDDLIQMLADCKAAGLKPAICSSYRTQEYQEYLFNKKVQYWRGNGLTDEEAYAKAGTSVAVPGTSEHQLGLALDIIDNGCWTLDERQAETATQQWLMANSWRYGFILRYPDGSSEVTGIIYEPWHYRYVGREVAAEIFDLGVCLEEYLEMLTTNVG